MSESCEIEILENKERREKASMPRTEKRETFALPDISETRDMFDLAESSILRPYALSRSPEKLFGNLEFVAPFWPKFM